MGPWKWAVGQVLVTDAQLREAQLESEAFFGRSKVPETLSPMDEIQVRSRMIVKRVGKTASMAR